eukprot:403330683
MSINYSQTFGVNSSLDDFTVLNKIGEGSYSSVYHIIRKEDQVHYALKKVNMGNLGEKEKENAINEVRILASIKHPCVSSYKEAFIDEASQSLCIVMELADDGDLYQKIQKLAQSQSYFQENDVIFGLKALHDLNIMHRDIKSANVFTNKDGSAKLGDMNVSKVASREGLNYTQTGTPYYASPEVWRDEPYTFVSDIWSLGCVLYEALTLKPPFQSTDMGGLYKKVLKGHYQKIPMHYSADLSIILKQMLQVKSENRPNCEQLIQMPIFMKKAKFYYPQFVQNYEMMDQSILLKTIKIPKSLIQSEETNFWNDLSQRLPKPNYERDSIGGQTEDNYDLPSNRSHLKNNQTSSNQNNESISKINLPQINSLKSIKGKESSPNLLRRKRNNKNKRSFEIHNSSLIKNQSMEMYGISENEDDVIERDYSLDIKHLNSQSMLLNEIPSHSRINNNNYSMIETPIVASQYELNREDDTYSYQREVQKRILLGKPIKHNINSLQSKKNTISINKPQLQLPAQKKNNSLMYDDYIKSYKIPQSILTPLQDNQLLQVQKQSSNLSVNERVQSNKESGLLPRIKNEKTRNINEYQDSVPTTTNKYRYQSELNNGSMSNNYKKSVLLKNHAYQHLQLQNNSVSSSSQLASHQSHSSLGKSSRSILLKNQIGIIIKNENPNQNPSKISSNQSYRIQSNTSNLQILDKPQLIQPMKLNLNSNHNITSDLQSNKSQQIQNPNQLNREFKSNLYQNMQQQLTMNLSKNYSKENHQQSQMGIIGVSGQYKISLTNKTNTQKQSNLYSQKQSYHSQHHNSAAGLIQLQQNQLNQGLQGSSNVQKNVLGGGLGAMSLQNIQQQISNQSMIYQL